MKRIQMKIGGMNKRQLVTALEEKKIALNPLALQLVEELDDNKLLEKQVVELVELTVAELLLPNGGTLLEIYNAATSKGLSLCEVEMAPLLSLQYNDYQNSTGLISTGKAPEAAITIASNILQDSEDFPKGFYLRKVEGVCWLRGYMCDHLHVFSPTDCFMFLSKCE